MLLKFFRKIFNPVTVFGVIIMLSQLIIGAKTVAKDPGTTWHLATGKWISEHQRVPNVDPFLSIERPWISDQWLSDLIFYKIYTLYGWEGLYFLVFLIFSIIIFFILLPKLFKETNSIFLSVFFAFLSVKMLQVHYLIRPVIFSFLLFALLIWHIHSWHRDKKIKVYLAPLLLLLWAQLHPSFVLGFALLGIGVVSLYFEKNINAKKFFFIACISFLVTFVNPYGISLHESVLWLGQSTYFMNLHQEWMPIQYLSDESQLALLTGLFGSVPFILIPKLRSKIPLFWILSTILFTVVSFKSVRYITYLGLISALPATISMSYFFLRFKRAKIIIRKVFSLERFTRKERSFSLMSIQIFIALLTVFFLVTGKYVFYKDVFGPPQDSYPYEEVQFIKQNLEKSVVAANPDFGGFLTWYGEGKISPIIDDRNTLVGEEFYKRFDQAQKTMTGYAQWARDNGAHFLVIKKLEAEKIIDSEILATPIFSGSIANVYNIHPRQ